VTSVYSNIERRSDFSNASVDHTEACNDFVKSRAQLPGLKSILREKHAENDIDLSVGHAAPEFVAQDVDGKTVLLSHSIPAIFVLDDKGVIRYRSLRGEELEKDVNTLAWACGRPSRPGAWARSSAPTSIETDRARPWRGRTSTGPQFSPRFRSRSGGRTTSGLRTLRHPRRNLIRSLPINLFALALTYLRHGPRTNR
jgi:hypothetical protein